MKKKLKEKCRVIAVDLGASNGRIISVSWDGERLKLDEIYRFANEGIRSGRRIYTDILYLYHEIVTGIRKAWQSEHQIDSVGIDSWGVDFALLDQEGELIGNPYHYRDAQVQGMMKEADKVFGEKRLFYLTGIQDMWYNTVYQILGIKKRKKEFFKNASRLLMLPDILGYFMTGIKNTEYTIASTTQFYDMTKKEWSAAVCNELEIDAQILPEILMTGEKKGDFTSEMKMWCGIPEDVTVCLTAVAEHDSASAACSVPAAEENYIFINSGTWSIIGMMLDEPLITDEVYQKNYSNEGGAYGKVKLVRSIMGMWLIQELRKSWGKQQKPEEYEYLIREAEKSSPFAFLLDVDDPVFASPVDMENAISEYIQATGQGIIEEQGEYYRAVMESLAFKYRESVKDLENISGKEINTVYLLGGAVQDKMFCQFIANATGKKVSAGPVEATAIGNAMVQLKALGVVKNEKEQVNWVKKSFDVCYYEPRETDLWDHMYKKYLNITESRR